MFVFTILVIVITMNVAEQFQEEISQIFDSFLALMCDSRPRVVVESQRNFGYCIVTVTLFKCRSCLTPFISSTFRIQRKSDLKYLCKLLDSIADTWATCLSSDEE